MMKRLLLCTLIVFLAVFPAGAVNLVKSYSYFTIGGKTLDGIQDEFSKRGPEVKSTGGRHPGATRMAFTTRLSYAESPGFCQIVAATVTVKVKVILPRWRHPRKIDPYVKLFWDTLSADITRHEERHVEIAKNHARELEDALKATGRQKDCATAKAEAARINAKILAKHDIAQARFDRVESINFESRILRLMQYRIERIQNGRLTG